MKFFNICLSLAFCASVGMASLSANASNVAFNRHILKNDYHGREFRGKKPFAIDYTKPELKNDRSNTANTRFAAPKPDLSFSQMPNYDYLEGPDGSTWFYTAEYDIETVVHNPMWTEELIKGFTFTIYDSSFNLIGTVKDNIELAPNETRAREVVIDPTVSANFFNTDDNYEIMVFHVMNTEQYVNHMYYKVYSIGGEKDPDGTDKCLQIIEGSCVDAINATPGESEENIYYTFVVDPVIDESHKPSDPDYVDYLNTLAYDVCTYKKATETEGPSLLYRKSIFVTRVPGDTTEGMYLITKAVNGILYLVYSQYAKPYFVNPVGGAIDESATPDNSLNIEVYSSTGQTPTLVSSTFIPVQDYTTTEKLKYTFLSIGNLSWKDDIDMLINGRPGAPAFIVQTDVVEAATLEDANTSFDIYSNEGKLLNHITDGSEEFIMMDTPQNSEPECMFVDFDENGDYVFNFKGLYSCEKLLSISQKNNGDPISAICARVVTPAGKIMYAFEMSNFEEGADKNIYTRVAWFDNQGKLDHIDKINIGQNLQYASVNISTLVLDPYLYDDDDAMEYAVLVKRTVGATTRNEFVVVDDTGKQFITFSADDGKGDPRVFSILPGEPNRLMMAYEQDYRYTVDLYNLPFRLEEDSVEGIIDDNGHLAYFDGETVFAEGGNIEIFNSLGVCVKSGKDSLSVNTLAKGIYVVKAIFANGEIKTFKINN